jgi:UDPglucose 6-dehydrogenase
MDIAVIGQGYVGTTAAVCLAAARHRVTGIETDHGRLAALQRAEAPMYEPGLQELLAETIGARTLWFAGSLGSLPAPVDAIVGAVGAPQLPSGGADLR